jgi:ApaG protein
MSHRYSQVSHDIEVVAEPAFNAENSNLNAGVYLYSYKITLTNRGNESVQLLRRHWVIMDGLGRREDVEGEGVIGQTPQIQPGESFEYTSFCPLSTPSGSMTGHYTFRANNGDRFEVKIPEFYLKDPMFLN